MHIVVGIVLLIVGLVNINLIRLGIETGQVQSRLFNITKEQSPNAFWAAMVFQGAVSAMCFSLAMYWFSGPEQIF